MARTTSDAVEALLLQQYDSVNSPVLTGFIETANVVVSRVDTCATSKGYTLSVTELELIERWLAAHYYAIGDPTYQSKRTGKASGTFRGNTDMGLDSTLFGQQAKTLDPSGCLNKVGKTVAVGGYWLGKPPSTQIDYVDRD